MALKGHYSRIGQLVLLSNVLQHQVFVLAVNVAIRDEEPVSLELSDLVRGFIVREELPERRLPYRDRGAGRNRLQTTSRRVTE